MLSAGDFSRELALAAAGLRLCCELAVLPANTDERGGVFFSVVRTGGMPVGLRVLAWQILIKMIFNVPCEQCQVAL